MTTLTVACLNNLHYCKFPEGVKSVPEFIAYLNDHFHSFVKLDFYMEKKCVAPYFVSDTTETQYMNIDFIRTVKEAEIHLLSEEEYLKKLAKVVAEKCVNCTHYTEDHCEQDLESHREHINLDGECFGFEVKKSE